MPITTKNMKARFSLIFCILAITAGRAATQTTLYSSSSTALAFSRCVVSRLGQSRIFSPEEQNSMVGVADVMARGLKSLDSGYRGQVSVKILLQAFVTSLADIVTHGGDSRTSLRQNTYCTAVEQCSLSTIGRVDIETVSESLRILYSLEDSLITRVREEAVPARSVDTDIAPPRTNPVPPAVPSAPVIPSPVQSPFMQTYFDRYSETAFKPPEKPFNIPLSPLPVQSSLIGLPPLGLPSFGSSSSLLQAGSNASSGLPRTRTGQNGDYSSLIDSHIAPSFQFGDFNVPQMKSSAVDYPQQTSQSSQIASIKELPAAQISFDQYPVQPSGQIGLPFSFDASSLRDASETTFKGIKGNPDQLFQTGPTDYIPHQIGGLSVPQRKESSIRVISPHTDPPPSDDTPSQDKSLPINIHHPSTSESPLLLNVNSFVTTTPASMPEMDTENKKFPIDSTLEKIVFNILTNSANFREAFNFGINPQNALNLAQMITQQSLIGYDTDMVTEALNAVSDAVARVTVNSPESYAVALSDALVHVLQTYNLPLFVDGSKVATSMLSSLDSMMQIPPEYISEQSGEFISLGDYTEVQETQLPFDYEFPVTAPEFTDVDMFSRALTQYILKSNELKDFFCQKNFSPNRMKMYFSLIKFSLADFGPQVSSIAASITSGNLLHLPDEVLCSSYAQTISVTIADILGENGLLTQAKAESIANKMSFSLRQQFSIPSQIPEKGDFTTEQSSTTLAASTTPVIQTSFTNNFDRSYQETTALPDIYNDPSTYLTTSSEDTYSQTDDAPGEISNPNEKIASSFTTSSPIEKYLAETATQSHTITFTSDIDDAQVANATRIMYSLIPSPITEGISTVEDKIFGISEDKIDKEKLSSFLSKEMESVVSAISDENIQEDKKLEDMVGTETKDIPENDDSQLTEEPEFGENPDTHSTQAPDVHVVKVRSSRHHSGSSRSIDYSSTVDNAYPEISITQYPADEDKSSFQLLNETLASRERLAYIADILTSKYTYAKAISQLIADLITFFKSKHFSLLRLCSKLNVFSSLLDIPPLDYCEEYAVIDYLLHVLQSMAKLLKDV